MVHEQAGPLRQGIAMRDLFRRSFPDRFAPALGVFDVDSDEAATAVIVDIADQRIERGKVAR